MNKLSIPSYADGLKELRENLGNMLPADALAVFDQDAEVLQQAHKSILKLHVGDKAPNFTLSNATNDPVILNDLLRDTKVVLVFYRGTWCPYCNLQLAQYQQVLSEIEAAGAQLVAISPQTPDESLNIQQKNELAFEVLSDPGNSIARQFTTVFKYGDQPLEAMAKLGYDFNSFYSDDSGEIPVPAVFIIEKDSRISFAQSTGGDYRTRVEAKALLEALD